MSRTQTTFSFESRTLTPQTHTTCTFSSPQAAPRSGLSLRWEPRRPGRSLWPKSNKSSSASFLRQARTVASTNKQGPTWTWPGKLPTSLTSEGLKPTPRSTSHPVTAPTLGLVPQVCRGPATSRRRVPSCVSPSKTLGWRPRPQSPRESTALNLKERRLLRA